MANTSKDIKTTVNTTIKCSNVVHRTSQTLTSLIFTSAVTLNPQVSFMLHDDIYVSNP